MMNAFRLIAGLVISILVVGGVSLLISFRYPSWVTHAKNGGEIAQYWMTVAAIITAGWWAFFHFVKRRPYASRTKVDISLQATGECENGIPVGIMRVTLINASRGKLHLEEILKQHKRASGICLVTVIPIHKSADTRSKDAKIKKGVNYSFFSKVNNLEPEQEAIEEQLVLLGAIPEQEMIEENSFQSVFEVTVKSFIFRDLPDMYEEVVKYFYFPEE